MTKINQFRATIPLWAIVAKLVFILVFSLCFTGLAQTVFVTSPIIFWHPSSTGLTSQDVEALATTPISPTVLYAGTWGEGVFRSSDHGATWEPASQGLTLPMYIQAALAVNPITPTVLYAGDYYGDGLYRSLNGGLSWTLSLPEAAVRAVAVHPFSPTVVLVGDRQEGLFRSPDGGDSWTRVTATAGFTATQAQVLAIAPTAPYTAYVGAGPVVLSSGNAGQTWMVQGTLSSTIQALAVHPLTPSLLYAGTFNHGLHRSSDGGASWSPLANGLGAQEWVTSLALDPISPTVLYAGTWSGQVYRSSDGGAFWEGLGHLGYVYSVLVHPLETGVIYAGTSNNGVFRGSSLDHLAMAPVDSPQYVNHTFAITITAYDALGFPLTGASPAQLVAIAQRDPALAETLATGGFGGSANLVDASGTITPTRITFVDGIAVAEVVVTTEILSDTITATVVGGPSIVSNPFNVLWKGRILLPLLVKQTRF